MLPATSPSKEAPATNKSNRRHHCDFLFYVHITLAKFRRFLLYIRTRFLSAELRGGKPPRFPLRG
ncbi:MAG: hypothetical protein A3A32_03800 [Candidatus Wildermuthbacteria bacterium RIFCSPLOWO2_01_FULL_48_35]|uniref:Uncharacterized protein n=1 Tax=Candidatus Wildermuthbacteria bacterium RIFCSPLOWO2_01_FULL_48_35 TaxID=1802463 RepID=A0A1G2RQ24_9BACT|nr:MAG: hypothetical protein A3A32_03800 [Candidatus Wildermuthbacteria bacterium RIFCSPLOWO2_01_FULL_48_35]